MNEHDPYNGLPFRIIWEERCVAGAAEAAIPAAPPKGRVSGVVRPKVPSVSLKRMLTLDTAFLQWISESERPAAVVVRPQTIDLTIELHDEAGKSVVAYVVHGCRVEKYTAPAFNAKGNVTAVESLTLQNDGVSIPI